MECEVKWALESITTNKANGGDGITVELFQILKDDAVKVLHSICQHSAMDCSPPGSSVHGILQARALEWLPCPPPGDLPNPGTESESLTSPALASTELELDTQASSCLRKGTPLSSLIV